MALKGRTPTAEEKKWLNRITQPDIGCVVCRLTFNIYSPAEPHHIDGKTKPGAHLKTIPLCPPHHRHGLDTVACTSRHPHKARFEERYGSEDYLLEATKCMIKHIDSDWRGQ